MHAELTDLSAHWLAAGHHPAAVRARILRDLPGEGTPVHRPGGLLRHLLRDVPPVPGPGNAPAPTGPSPAAPAPIAEQPCPERPSARPAGLREGEGDHVRATPFRPAGDETLCRRCVNSPAHARLPAPRPRPAVRGTGPPYDRGPVVRVPARSLGVEPALGPPPGPGGCRTGPGSRRRGGCRRQAWDGRTAYGGMR